jgi:hypothetical protein
MDTERKGIAFDFTALSEDVKTVQELRNGRPHGEEREDEDKGGSKIYAGVPSVPTFDGTPAAVFHFEPPPMLEPNL